MVEVVQDGQIRAYADFDNRSLPRNPQRTALANLPVLDISPFLRESTPDERIHMARALRSAPSRLGTATRRVLDAVVQLMIPARWR